jgi:hypothetical protein
MAKRGRKPKVKAGVAKIDVKKLEREGNPEVKFLADLRQFDRTHVDGMDPDKHYYWGQEADLGLHESQGYVKSDGEGLKTLCPGDGVVWPAEGKQSNQPGKDLILLEMPKERREMRDAYEAQQRQEMQKAESSKMAKEATKGADSEVASLFTPSKDFLADLERG